MNENLTQSNPDLLAQQLYWKQRLSGNPPITNLIPEGPRPAQAPFQERRLVLDADLSLKILKTAKGSALSAYLLLTAALTALLHRYTGNRQILIATPLYKPEGDASSRVDLPLLLSVSSQDCFKDHLLALRQAALDAYSNQDLPYQQIVEALSASLELESRSACRIAAWMEGLHSTQGGLEYDFAWTFAVEGQSISARLRYDSAIFRGDSIESFAACYPALLAGAIQNPGQPIAGLPLISPEQQQRIVAQLNDNGLACPVGSVFELFQSQARLAPHRIAAVCGASWISYAALDRLCGQGTHRLRAAGAGPEVVAALVADRSLEFLVAMLAIFKAGGAYLPLDPGQPARRTLQMLAQSRSPLAVVEEKYLKGLSEALQDMPPSQRPRIVPLQSLSAPHLDKVAAAVDCGDEGLSYVFFTSGSTGIPKGAMCVQAGLRNHLFAKIGDFSIGDGDVVAQNASQCFDVSVWQLLAPLLAGGRTCILDDETVRDPLALLDSLSRQSVSVLELVPSQLRALCEAGLAGDRGRFKLGQLRLLFIMGEVLPPELCRSWASLFPATLLVNGYGTTEASDDVTHHALSPLPGPDVLRVPVGAALPNMKIYLLDRNLSAVPAGFPGEIYIGGLSVGRGYMHDPLQTAAAYLPDPFSARPGGRLYKTGDLGRFLAGGVIDFLGRIDHQVKIRGYRIECGEIEAVLGNHPQVADQAVLAREDRPGQKRLVAYAVPRPASSLDAASLRAFLRQWLPEHMVPSDFVILEALPLNSNGKLERHSLPVPEGWDETAYTAPRTPDEEAMAEIWASVLKAERVGIHDNFFDCGGHSLLATQVMSRVGSAFGVEVPLKTLFEKPTIAQLSLEVMHAQLSQIGESEASLLLEELGV